MSICPWNLNYFRLPTQAKIKCHGKRVKQFSQNFYLVRKGFKKSCKIYDMRTSFVMNSDRCFASDPDCNNFKEFELFDKTLFIASVFRYAVYLTFPFKISIITKQAGNWPAVMTRIVVDRSTDNAKLHFDLSSWSITLRFWQRLIIKIVWT